MAKLQSTMPQMLCTCICCFVDAEARSGTIPPVNDCCQHAIEIAEDQSIRYATIGANTDGPQHAACGFCGDPQVHHDIWFAFSPVTTGVFQISNCDASYDAKIAVYDGCSCPVSGTNLLACFDDQCGLQNLFNVNLAGGNCYTIRVGGYQGQTGSGSLVVQLDPGRPPAICAPGSAHDCCTPGKAGCGDSSCCEAVCGQDSFCCSSEWDSLCVSQANEICCTKGNGGYCPNIACSPENPQTCDVGGDLPGCSDPQCCQTICAFDPFCCQVAWDETCVEYMLLGLCDLPPCEVTCKSGSINEEEPCGFDTNSGCGSIAACEGPFPDCCTATGQLGCSDPTCQQSICAIDPFCCETAWDGICAAEACDDPNCLCEPDPDGPFQVLQSGDSICGTFWSSTSIRDTDWYKFNVVESGTLVMWKVTSEFPPAVFILEGCPPTLLATGGMNRCETTASTALPAGSYFAFVAPAAFVHLPCDKSGNHYIGQLTFALLCLGDIDGPSGRPNGIVDVDDLLSVINQWGDCLKPPMPCVADLSNNGIVDVDDLLIVINAWGPCP